MSRPLFTWARRVAISIGLAVLLGYLPYRLYAGSGLHRYLRLQSERETLHRSNVDTHFANEKLRRELEGLRGPSGELSRAAVERAARDELGLIKPGEIIYKIEGLP